MINKIKKNQGITLISLTITIVVLIILTTIVANKNFFLENIFGIKKKASQNIEIAQSNIDDLKNNKNDNTIGTRNYNMKSDIVLSAEEVGIDSIKVKLEILQKEGEINYIEYAIKKENEEEYSYYKSTERKHTFFDLINGETYEIKCIIHDVNGGTIEKNATLNNNTKIQIQNNMGLKIDNMDSGRWQFFYDDDDYYYVMLSTYATYDELGIKNGKKWNTSDNTEFNSFIDEVDLDDDCDAASEYNDDELNNVLGKEKLRSIRNK